MSDIDIVLAEERESGARAGASDVERVVRLAKDYAKAGCVFSIYQNDGAGLWHKRGEINGCDMAKILGKK